MIKKRGTTDRKCNACGHEWKTAPDSVQLNVNCPACGAEHADLATELKATQPEES